MTVYVELDQVCNTYIVHVSVMSDVIQAITSMIFTQLSCFVSIQKL